MKNWCWLVVVALSVSGCAMPSKYRADLVVEQRVQEAAVKQLAASSASILEFAEQLYITAPINRGSGFIVVDKEFVKDTDSGGYPENQLFETYCAVKGGAVYRLDMVGNDYAFSWLRAQSKICLSCEVAGKHAAALIYEYLNTSLLDYPFVVNKAFIDGAYLEQMFADSKLFGFATSDAAIIFPGSYLNRSNPSENFSFIVNVANPTPETAVLNLASAQLVMGGKKYRMEPLVSAAAPSPVLWAVAGAEAIDHAAGGGWRIVLAPGERFCGEIVFHIPQVNYIRDVDIKPAEVHLDGVTHAGFRIFGYYELLKRPLD